MLKSTDYQNMQKSGLIPYFVLPNGEINVCLMIPSDPNYGGSLPQIAKGGIEKDETPEQAAKREAWEELGLDESQIEYISLLGKTQQRFHWFAAKVRSMNLEPAGEETGEVVWIDFKQAFSVIRPWQKSILGMLAQHIKRTQKT